MDDVLAGVFGCLEFTSQNTKHEPLITKEGKYTHLITKKKEEEINKISYANKQKILQEFRHCHY